MENEVVLPLATYAAHQCVGSVCPEGGFAMCRSLGPFFNALASVFDLTWSLVASVVAAQHIFTVLKKDLITWRYKAVGRMNALADEIRPSFTFLQGPYSHFSPQFTFVSHFAAEVTRGVCGALPVLTSL